MGIQSVKRVEITASKVGKYGGLLKGMQRLLRGLFCQEHLGRYLMEAPGRDMRVTTS
jgi:hypothetical protein